MKLVIDPQDIPCGGPHYAILRYETVKVAADKRSREKPGHGCPEHPRKIVTYHVYKDRDEWEGEIKKLTVDGHTFTALTCTHHHVSITVEVS